MPRFAITGEIDINYYLVLNMMRDRTEAQTAFGPYESAEAALAYHDSQLAEQPYTEDGPNGFDPGATTAFLKSFKKGSELEWMNSLKPSEREKPGFFGHGVHRQLEKLEIKTQTRIS